MEGSLIGLAGAAKLCPEKGPLLSLVVIVNNPIVDYVAGGARVEAKAKKCPWSACDIIPTQWESRWSKYLSPTGHRMLRSDIIAIKTCHRHCQHLVRFIFAVAECSLIISCFIRSFPRSGCASTYP
jgi:hypothetical protein